MAAPRALFAGIDPALGNTGVVILDEQGQMIEHLNSRDIVKKPKKASDTPDYYSILRMEMITECVTWLFTKQGKDARIFCSCEDYSHDSTHRVFTMAEFNGVLRLGIVKAVGHLHLIAPSTLKKFGANHGHATKEQMVAQAKEESAAIAKLSKKQLTSDICDAYFLAKHAWYRYAPHAAAKHETNRQWLRARLELAGRDKESKA